MYDHPHDCALWPIDTPVLVRDHDQEKWHHRHWAGLSAGGQPLTWPNGVTSWVLKEHHADPQTSPLLGVSWQQVRLAVEDSAV